MKKKLSAIESNDLLETLRKRFESHPLRHKHIAWEDVVAKLGAAPAALPVLWNMEDTGGEPDVIGFDKSAKQYLFADCSAESPKERRSLCYDDAALKARKENKPRGSAMQMAEDMGVQLMTEEQYHQLQQLGQFDTKTSSWIVTPDNIRRLGGALFGDRRYNTVFTYHNGAESYYAARGFRGLLRV